MTREEAKIALTNGHRISHRLFDPSEYLYLRGRDVIIASSGDKLKPTRLWRALRSQGWDEGWYIFDDSTHNV